MNKNLLEAGKIVNTHSLKGEVRIYPYCDSAEFICDLDHLYIDNVKTKIISARVHKGQALIKFKDINHINQAEPLVGKLVYINKTEIDLDEGQYFIEDIKGLDVYDANTNEFYGKVSNVIETGANDVFEIKNNHKTLLVPKINDVIKKIDIENRIILITPLKGLFE